MDDTFKLTLGVTLGGMEVIFRLALGGPLGAGTDEFEDGDGVTLATVNPLLGTEVLSPKNGVRFASELVNGGPVEEPFTLGLGVKLGGAVEFAETGGTPKSEKPGEVVVALKDRGGIITDTVSTTRKVETAGVDAAVPGSVEFRTVEDKGNGVRFASEFVKGGPVEVDELFKLGLGVTLAPVPGKEVLPLKNGTRGASLSVNGGPVEVDEAFELGVGVMTPLPPVTDVVAVPPWIEKPADPPADVMLTFGGGANEGGITPFVAVEDTIAVPPEIVILPVPVLAGGITPESPVEPKV